MRSAGCARPCPATARSTAPTAWWRLRSARNVRRLQCAEPSAAHPDDNNQGEPLMRSLPRLSRWSPLLAALCAGAALLTGGCMRTTSGGGLGGYSYRMGELRSEMTESLDRTYHAAVAAVDLSHLIIRSEERTDSSVRLMAERGDGMKVKVQIQRLSP